MYVGASEDLGDWIFAFGLLRYDKFIKEFCGCCRIMDVSVVGGS
jgi:hypothetical protein